MPTFMYVMGILWLVTPMTVLSHSDHLIIAHIWIIGGMIVAAINHTKES